MIKNLIFDLGGVVLDIRYENVAEAFARQGVPNTESFFSRHAQSHEMDLFEEGKMTSPQFRNYVRHMAGLPFSDTQVDECLNAILLTIPERRVALLTQLKKRYGTFLFSNTNAINYDSFTATARQQYGFDVFERCFHATYFSHLMGVRKPSLDGFKRIVKEQRLVAAETLFIDDNPNNVAAARMAGLQGFHLERGNDIAQLFERRPAAFPLF
ncbi:MAG: HAD family phosphatase [Bacteroidales bacterium]|nr:HAD family phosphatase [Bacteroidales bacterium]